MSTKKKLVLLAGAAALFYMYKKHQAKAGQQIQYYRSKNGRVYYREPNNPNVRIPGTNSTNPNGRQSARPPATNVPNSTTVRRRPRPSTNDNPPPPSIR